MDTVNSFDAAQLATADKPTGYITNAIIKGPKIQEFVFDDAKADFGKWAFRFANGSITDAPAAALPITKAYEGEMGFAGNLFAITFIVGLCAVAYPGVMKGAKAFFKPYTKEIPEGRERNWIQGPQKFPFVGYSEDPLRLNKFRGEETKRVTDHIEKLSAFYAAQEPIYEA